jgi:hypothetical protein
MPKKEKRHKYEVPLLPDYSGCTEAVVCVPSEWIPLIAGHIGRLEQRHEWATDEDWREGLTVVLQIQEHLMTCLNTGIQTIIDEQRRLYRLLDTALNGAAYTATAYGPINGGGGSWGEGGGGGGTWGDADGGGGSWGSTADGDYTVVPEEDNEYLYVINPPLPPVPTDPIAPGMRVDLKALPDMAALLAHASGLADGATPAQIAAMLPALGQRLTEIDQQGLDNLGLLITEIARYPNAGTIPAGWLGLGERKVELADVLQALRVGDAGDQSSLWSKFQAILNAGGDIAQITSTLNDLFNTTVGNMTEGGILAMVIGSALANAASAQQNASDLQRIIKALDGGAEPADYQDNILQALRGDVEASAERNAVSLLQEIKDRLTEADPNDDSLLEELRKLLL